MDTEVLRWILVDYDGWATVQKEIDDKFTEGRLTRYEYWMATVLNLAEHKPPNNESHFDNRHFSKFVN